MTGANMETNSKGLLKLNREQTLKLVQACKEDTNRKGVIILGSPGVGKTTVLETVFNKRVNTFDLSELAKKNEGDVTECMKTATVETKNISKNKHNAYYKTTGIMLDDLGQELYVKVYGQTIDPIDTIIQKAYNSKYRLWGTSNSNLQMLTERYGPRVVDRIKEMCYIVILDDTQLRDNIKQDNQEIKNLLS